MAEASSTYHDLISHFLVASSTVLIYDYCLTLDTEYKFIWRPRPFTWFNVLYLVQRYLPLLDTVILLNLGILSPGTHSQNHCNGMFNLSLWLHVAGLALSEVILSLRIWALARDRVHRLARIMAVCFVLAWGTIISTGILFWTRNQLAFRPKSDPGLTQTCVHGEKTASTLIMYGVFELYESGGLVLLICAAISIYKDRKLSRLYAPVYLSGILQYVLMSTMFAIQVPVVICISAKFNLVLMPLFRVLHSISTSRIVLHIRETMDTPVAYDENSLCRVTAMVTDTTDESGGGLSAIEFA